MNVVIRLTKGEEAKALPILLRHTPGTVLQNRPLAQVKLLLDG